MDPVRKQTEPDGRGAPEWMVTFSDCMTLLLTFFVLLLSFSSFDERTFWELKIIYCNALPKISLFTKSEKDSVLPPVGFLDTDELDKGSEKPTLDKGAEEALKRETGLVDLRYRRVFLIASKRIFLGSSTALSPEGRDIMSTMARFLKEVRGRTVISENAPGSGESSEQLGLWRARAIMEYLTTDQKLDKRRFSISATSTVGQGRFESDRPGFSSRQGQRRLEIVLLERSIYN